MEFSLEDVCFQSYAPVKSSAYIKVIKDMQFEGIPDDFEFVHCHMARMGGSQYMMNIGFAIYFVDTKSLTAKKADFDMSNATGRYIKADIQDYDLQHCFINGEYMLLLTGFGGMAILRGLKYIGQIKFDYKLDACKNRQPIYSRYAQQVGNTVYALDHSRSLYRIEWQDIKEGIYEKKHIKSKVDNFYVDRVLFLSTLDNDGTLYLDNEVVVHLTKVNTEAQWLIVTCVANYWIVSGGLDLDRDGHAIIAAVNKHGEIKSTLKFKLTTNGCVDQISQNYDSPVEGGYFAKFADTEGGTVKFAGIFALRKVYITGMRGIMMAIDRDGCCHLIAVDYGRLSLLQSIDSIVPRYIEKENHLVMSVTATAVKGQFIVGGLGWTRMISVKVK